MSSAPATSTIYVKVPVSSTASGSAVDPTSGTVSMAFLEVGSAAPAADSTDWESASWETDSTRDPDRYMAKCLTGPSGEVPLTAGQEYDVWVKITGIGSEVVIDRAGRHTAT